MTKKRELLLIVHDPSLRISMQRNLEQEGKYKVFITSSGKEALKSIERNVPDLIISDMYGNKIDGIELCNAVRNSESTKNVPFIFLAAKKDKIIEGIKSGSDDYLIKPFKREELVAKINAVFKRFESTRYQAHIQKGKLEEHNFDEILNICTQQAFSGDLILRQKNEEALVLINKGEIVTINYKNFNEDQALDKIRNWNSGAFILKSKPIKLKSKTKSGQNIINHDAEINLNKAVKIAEDTWWVGHRNKNSLLQLNVYLRQFHKDRKTINYLIDPGSPIDFPVISNKISSIIKNMSKIHVYSINHQDPDVAMNAVFLKDFNSKAICITTEENWQIVSHYDLDPKNVKLINEFTDWRVDLATQHGLQYIPSPFCHAKGAFLTYDLQTRVLFTGDLFAGINNADNLNSLWANEDHFEGVKAFHQLYMPTNKAIRYTIQQIKKLKPQPLIIAPHHGGIIRGPHIDSFMDRLFNLEVGIDLQEIDYSSEHNKKYIDVVNEILLFAQTLYSRDKVYQYLTEDEILDSLCSFNKDRVKIIYDNPEAAIERIIGILIKIGSPAEIKQIKSIALKSTVSRNLPPPSLGWDLTETISFSPKNIFKD